MHFVDYLRATNQSLTILELERAGFNVSKEEIKKLVRKGVLKQVEHFAENSSKGFINKDKKFEKIKGTRYYTYEVV